jgi:hypothetical protein
VSLSLFAPRALWLARIGACTCHLASWIPSSPATIRAIPRRHSSLRAASPRAVTQSATSARVLIMLPSGIFLDRSAASTPSEQPIGVVMVMRHLRGTT